MSPDTLARATGARIDRARTHAAPLTAAMVEYRIDTPARQAAFLAQVSHETGQLHWMAELWGPTPQQLKYEPPSELAEQLGNLQPGDGHRFRGRGDIQITGRSNYSVYGALLGIDLIGNPDAAAEPALAARVAGLYWQRNDCNELADVGDFMRITKRINGGTTGFEKRMALWLGARNALGLA